MTLKVEVAADVPPVVNVDGDRLFRRDGLNVRGAGLALLLISDICIAHGGKADVRSSIDRSDHGTTVRLTLLTAK